MARATTAHGLRGADMGRQGPWNLFPPFGPSLPDARRHFQGGSHLLPRVPGASWWLPEAQHEEGVRQAGRYLDPAASLLQLL